MFRRILIANRGEIAVRIVRACREAGITSIAVYSEADHDSLHALLADESICIGPAPPAESYLNISCLIAAAEICDAQAIHPGYGFLAENTQFARVCRECDIAFIGPTTEALALSGNKAVCRETVRAAGVPVVPGSDGLIDDGDEALRVARAIGFPVLVKASAGGGGRGMRIAHNDVALKTAVSLAASEAQTAFGDAGVYLEKFIEDARHVEFQILADEHGRTITLGERECSIQRRHQKLIEETPSPALDDALRARMTEAALKAAEVIGYTNAGTAEFLLGPDGRFHFIEFNARIQVEHTVTEEVTGIDLIREQIRIAAGEPLSEMHLEPTGCAIEARIYAEDPDNDLVPCAGVVTGCHFPGGPRIRVDTHLFSGCTVPPYYDSLIAKVIARGRRRDEVIDRLAGALDEFIAEGITNTARFCARIIRSDRFRRGELGPDLIDEHLPERR